MDQLPLSTFTVSVQGLGVILKTFANHFIHRKQIIEQVPAREDLLFDEAFCIVKHFFERASLSTVEDLQKFGNNYTPSPPWVRVVKVIVPLSTRLDAGKLLIETIGEKEIKEVIGGREWWQRSLSKDGGVKGEWIAMKSDWNGLDEEVDESPKDEVGVNELRKEKLDSLKARGEAKEKELKEKLKGKMKGKSKDKEQEKEEINQMREEETPTEAQERVEENNQEPGEEENYSPEMDEMRCTLYLFGGIYLFGSASTHRFLIWRLARKTSGRSFVVNYRLAPQFPFPCALQDALSAYLYLIRPPPGAKHKPVDPKKLTIAGDSAGGGLTLALLCLIRDSGLPAPAGAVLISPWVDLTHSFPSILTNTETDIIPPYGFLFKPSTLWPPPPQEFQSRANDSTSLDNLKDIYLQKQEEKKTSSGRGSSFLTFGRKKKLSTGSASTSTSTNASELNGNNQAANNKGDQLANDTNAGNITQPESGLNPNVDTNPKLAEKGKGGINSDSNGESKTEVAEVLKIKIDGEEVEIDSQIQLYATNSQLAYPFVSPLWQPSLGGLPPLYILAGDNEVLRDEIIYLAHRAANPSKYPIRQALLDSNPERSRLGKDYPPTKVHLQIYDDCPHDLPLFSFTTPAKFAYRAMSSFIKFVTASEEEVLAHQSSSIPTESSTLDSTTPTSNSTSSPTSDLSSNLTVPDLNQPRKRSNSTLSNILQSTFNRDSKPKPLSTPLTTGLEATIYSSAQPFNRPTYVDNMIRERVGINGVVRDLEPVEELEVLRLDPEEIGLIKEGPVKRYLAGKAIWDKKFAKAYKKVQKRREHHLTQSMAEETERIRKRYEKSSTSNSNSSSTKSSTLSPNLPQNGENIRSSSPEPIEEEEEAIEGIWNLHGETPPPSSIAARKDTSEARKMAKVLDTHYSKIHALHLWTAANEVEGIKSTPRRQDSQV